MNGNPFKANTVVAIKLARRLFHAQKQNGRHPKTAAVAPNAGESRYFTTGRSTMLR